MRTVPDGDVLCPAGENVSGRQCPGVLSFEPVAAMGDQIDLEEAGLLLHLIHGLAYLQRRAQRRSGCGCGHGLRIPGVLGGFEPPVDGRRAHRHQLSAHVIGEPGCDRFQLSEAFQAGQRIGLNRRQLRTAGLSHLRPDQLQHLERVIAVRTRPWSAFGCAGPALALIVSSSRIRPLSVLDARRYSRASFFVISFFVSIDNR